MNKTVTVHAMWRSGGTAFSWAIAAAYRRSLICEPLFHPDHVLEIPRFALDEFLVDHGMREPGDLVKALDKLRYCPLSVVSANLLSLAREFMALVLKWTPNVGVIKLIGMEEIGDLLSFTDDIKLYQNRSFLQQAGSMLRLQWRVDLLVKDHVSPLMVSEHQSDGLREALDRVSGLALKNDIIRSAALLWLTHAHNSIRLEAEGRGKHFWVNDYDKESMAELIREHMGPEEDGTLEENFLKPKGWVPNLESMGGTVESWWRPEDEISYDQLLPLAAKLAEELRRVEDPIISGLAERVI